MNAPGVQAKKTGKRVKRGKCLQVMTYPRKRSKALLVQAARDLGRPLSSFMILSSLMAAAKLRGCEIQELIPRDELEQYRAARVDRGGSFRATRGSVNRRPKST